MTRRLRILLVEDSPTWRKILECALRDDYDLEFEEHAFGAISRIAGEYDKLDLVIIDYELPQYTGDVIETMVKKTGLKAVYFTGHKPTEIADRVSFPILQKAAGVSSLMRQIKSVCMGERKALAL